MLNNMAAPDACRFLENILRLAHISGFDWGPASYRPTSHARLRKLRRLGVHVEDFDLASCSTAAFDSHVGGDGQGDVESFGQGDILSVVGGQVA